MMGETFSKPRAIYTFYKIRCRKKGQEVGWWTEFFTEHSPVGNFFLMGQQYRTLQLLYTMPYYSQEEIILDPHAHNDEPLSVCVTIFHWKRCASTVCTCNGRRVSSVSVFATGPLTRPCAFRAASPPPTSASASIFTPA